MKQDMCGVWDNPIPFRQEGVGVAEHFLIALGPFGFGLEKVGYPPGAHLADEEYAVGDPQPLIEPSWIGLAEIPGAEDQTDGKRHALHKGDSHKTPQGVLAAHGSNVVQAAKGNPVVHPKKGNLKRLESKQDLL